MPDMVFTGLDQTSVSQNGRVEIVANRLEVFNNEDYSMFHGAKIKEFGEEKQQNLFAKADRVKVLGNNDGEAFGNIDIIQISDGSELKAQQLKWNSLERMLTGEQGVTIMLEDGMTVSSTKMEADVSRRVFIFTGEVEGTLDED